MNDKPLPVFPTEAHETASDWAMRAIGIEVPVTLSFDNWAAISGILSAVADDLDAYTADMREHVKRMSDEIDRQIEAAADQMFGEES